jgi:site-specific DNA-methyltransferase (adenine-specific)
MNKAKRNECMLDPLIVRLSDSVTIIRGDCLAMLDGLEFDAVVTDPPYGIAFQRGNSGRGIDCNTNRKPIHGDDHPFDPRHIISLEGCSKTRAGKPRTPVRPVVMFGPNHYAKHMPDHGQWLVWDKSCGKGAASSFVDAEFIWMNRRNPRCIFRHFWMGCMRTGDCNPGRMKRTHPSMKPPELMAWLIETARIGVGKTVLDPYMGSGTTGIACIRTGRKFIGIEIDAEYFDIARKRIENELRQGLLPLTHNVGIDYQARLP